ncbi:hypothetical protein GCM10010421_60040 [Streptomyces glaucus]|uniref:Secreted protein n=1 Tax=Streptomyces glaucus TaxID=284029 RepID=A0ABP5XMY4_9ACTN
MARADRATRGRAAATAPATRGRTTPTARDSPGRTALAIRATCGPAARQGLSSGTTTSPFRDHTPA